MYNYLYIRYKYILLFDLLHSTNVNNYNYLYEWFIILYLLFIPMAYMIGYLLRMDSSFNIYWFVLNSR